MQIQPQVSFHHLPASPAVESDVRQRIDDLDKFYDRITSCRVTVEAPEGHHHQGGLFRVRIDLGVPGEHIVVGQSPDRDGAHEDVYVAVRDAFAAVRRRLEDHVRRARGDVKSHHAPPHGRVVHLEPDLGYGRLAAADGRQIYFHRNSVIGGIDRLRVGSEVRFHEEAGNDGPQASSVETVGEHGHHTPSVA